MISDQDIEEALKIDENNFDDEVSYDLLFDDRLIEILDSDDLDSI